MLLGSKYVAAAVMQPPQSVCESIFQSVPCFSHVHMNHPFTEVGIRIGRRLDNHYARVVGLVLLLIVKSSTY